MKTLFFIAFAAIASLRLSAQGETWHTGALVTSQNEVLTGELLFDPRFDIVVIRNNDQTDVITADRIGSFRYYDNRSDINRKFISLSDVTAGVVKRIYEVVLNGPIGVVRKAKSSTAVEKSDEEGYTYYFVKNGSVRNLRTFRSALYENIKPVVHSELRLDPNDMGDAIRMINLYNQTASPATDSR